MRRARQRFTAGLVLFCALAGAGLVWSALAPDASAVVSAP